MATRRRPGTFGSGTWMSICMALALCAAAAGWPAPARAQVPTVTTFTVDDATDLFGADYGGFAIPNGDFYACVNACRDDAACKSFTYLKAGMRGPGSQAMCFLKNAAPAKSANACCISGVKFQQGIIALSQGQASVHPGLNYIGFDFERTLLPSPTPQSCAQRCEANTACKAYTYVNPGIQGPAAVCFLKTAAQNATADGCCTSGVRGFSPRALDDVSLEPGVDRFGADFFGTELAVPDPIQCANLCKGEPRCQAYTFVNPAGGRRAQCFLKDPAPPGGVNSCCTSGVKSPDTNVGSPLVRGGLVAGPLLHTTQQCRDQGVNGVVSDVMDAVCAGSIAGLGITCTRNNVECQTQERQIAVGSTAHRYPAALSTSFTRLSSYVGHGGRGKLLGEATMCALRELSSRMPLVNGGTGGPIEASLDSNISLGKLSYKQRLGYLGFDVPSRTFTGYRTVSFCAPIVGCFDAVAQDLKIKLERYPIAPPILVPSASSSFGSSSGGGGFTAVPPGGGTVTLPQVSALDEYYALTVTSERNVRDVEMRPPSFTVPTPFGPIAVQPIFQYFAGAPFIGSPFKNVSVYQRLANEEPAWPHSATLEDLFGADQGIAYPLRGARGFGWQSHLALGNRDPRLSGATWSPVGSPPQRPDRKLDQARTDEERNPSAGITASARLSYPRAGDIDRYLPSWLPAGSVQFEIWVQPQARAAFSGQFDILAAEARAAVFSGEFQTGETPLSDLSLLGNAGGSFGFRFDAGVDLTVRIPILGGSIEIVDVHPRTGSNLGEGFTSRNAPKAYFASTIDPLNGGKAYNFFQTFKANLGTDTANQGEAYVAQCLSDTRSSPPEAAPTPKASPEDPRKLIDNALLEVPCNVCLYYGGDARLADKGLGPGQFKSHLFSPVARTAGARVWSCDQLYKNGCHDFCRLDAKTGILTFLRSADSTITIRNPRTNTTSNGERCYQNPIPIPQ